MSADMNVSCDDCGKRIDDGNSTYCHKCFDHLTERIEHLEEQIEELKAEKKST